MFLFLKNLRHCTRALFAAVCLLLGVSVAMGGNVALGYEVYLQGESLGVTSLFSPVIAKAEETEESAYYLRIISDETQTDETEMMKRLSLENGEGVEACVLYLNGTAILAVESEEVLANILEDYRTQYGEEGVLAFSKGVTFEMKLVSPESVCSEEEAKALLGGSDEEGAPLLSVLAVEESAWEEYIPHETIYENTDTLTRGHTVVKVKGQDGVIRHRGYILSADGKKVREIRLSSVQESAPATEVVLVGTREPGNGEGTGTYVRPCSGGFSSGFGSRWGRNHNGVDLRAPSGTSIVAADAGKVVFSGWNSGGFGYLVKIDHGNGIETWYAHCSELLVKEGDVVNQGELIARVGNTGRSTGNHLHFEIRIDGKAVNPGNYIAF